MRKIFKSITLLSVAVLSMPFISARTFTYQNGWCTYELDTETKTGRVIGCIGDYFNIIEEVYDGNEIYKTRSIGPNVFVGSSIRKATIPEYVTSINPKAFSGDNLLNEVTFASSTSPLELEGNAPEMFSGAPITKLYWDRPINGKMQMASSTLAEAYIGPNVLSLPEGIFYNTPALKTVTVADGTSDLKVVVTNVDDRPMGYTNLTFGDDAAVESLYVGRRITCASWGSTMNQYGLPFKNLKKLTSLTIGSKVAEITPVSSFAGALSLKSITIPATVKEAWAGIFANVPLEKVVIEDSEDELVKIGSGRLFGLSTIREVYLGRPFGKYLNDEFGNVEQLTIACSVEYTGFLNNNSTLKKLVFDAPGVLDNFNDCSQLTEVVVGDNVTALGDFAFKNCALLGSVSLGKGLESIAMNAFSGNKTLKTFTIPASVTYAPINYGDNLKSLFIADSDKELTLAVDKRMQESPFEAIYIGRSVLPSTSLIRNNVKSVEFANSLNIIPERLFYGDFKGKDLWIKWPAEVSKIGRQTFYYASFDKLIIPTAENLTIEEQAFYYSNIPTLSIRNTKKLVVKNNAFYSSKIMNLDMDTTGDNGISYVGDYAFYKATDLTGVDFASNVEKIGKNAFNGASKCVINSHIKNAPDTIGEYAFYGIQPSELIIDTGLKRLEAYSMSSILRLTLGDAIRDIEQPTVTENIFRYLSVATPEVWIKLARLTNSDYRSEFTINGTKVDEYPFGDLTIADDVTDVSKLTMNNPNITSLQLGKNVTYVDDKSFSKCPNLKTVYLNKNLQTCRHSFGYSVSTVNVEDLDSFVCINRNYNNFPAILSGAEGIRHNGELVKSYRFKTDNPKILFGAFYGVKSLENVVIPEGITQIDKYAFRLTALTDITLPSTLVTLAEGALPINNIVFPKGLKYLIRDSSTAWRDCNIYHFPQESLKYFDPIYNKEIEYERKFEEINTMHVPAGLKGYFAEAYNIDPAKIIDDLPGNASYAGDSNILSWEVFSDNNCSIVPDEYTLRLYSGENADEDNLLYEKHYDSFANEVPTPVSINERNRIPNSVGNVRAVAIDGMEWGQPYTYILEGRNSDDVVIVKHSDTITAGTSAVDNITVDDNQFGWNGSELTVAPSMIGQTLRVFGTDGRLILTTIVDSNTIKFDIEPGVYVVRTALSSFKFVKHN